MNNIIMTPKTIYGLLVVLCVILLGGVIYYFNTNSGSSFSDVLRFPGSDTREVPTVTTPTPIEQQPTQGSVASPKPKAAPKPTPVLTYDQALAQYGRYRFQLTQCHGTPGSISLKVGSKLMLDNKDVVMRKITFGNQTSYVGGRGFAIVQVTQIGAYPLLCDGAGAAQLNVQA